MCKALSIALAYIKCANVLLITTGIDGDNAGKDNKDLGLESVSCNKYKYWCIPSSLPSRTDIVILLSLIHI